MNSRIKNHLLEIYQLEIDQDKNLGKAPKTTIKKHGFALKKQNQRAGKKIAKIKKGTLKIKYRK
jgi:hypothetical protein